MTRSNQNDTLFIQNDEKSAQTNEFWDQKYLNRLSMQKKKKKKKKKRTVDPTPETCYVWHPIKTDTVAILRYPVEQKVEKYYVMVSLKKQKQNNLNKNKNKQTNKQTKRYFI